MEMYSSRFISKQIYNIDDDSIAKVSLNGGAWPMTIDP